MKSKNKSALEPLFAASTPLLAVYIMAFTLLALAQKYVWATSEGAELGGFERNVIYGIIHFMEHGELYQNPQMPPFSIIQYNPLYYVVVSAVAWLSGINQQADVHQIYTLGRLLNLFFSLASGLLLYQLLSLFSVRKATALALTALWLAIAPQGFISARPDTLKHLLFMGAVFSALVYADGYEGKWLLTSFICAFLAFFTKQDGFVAIGIPLVALWVTGNFKKALIGGVACILALAISIYFIEKATGSQYLANVVGGLKNGISLSWFYSTFSGFFISHVWLLGPALWWAVRQLLSEKQQTILSFSILSSFILPLVFSLKYGSAPNYFNECVMLCFIPLGIIIQQIQVELGKDLSLKWLWLISVLLITFMPFYAYTTGVFLNQEDRLRQERLLQKNLALWLQPRLKDDEWVLCLIRAQWQDHVTNYFHKKAIIPQRDVWTQIFSAQNGQGMMYLAEPFAAGKVKYVISDQPQLPEKFLNIPLERYVSVKSMAGLYIFRYQP